MRFKRVSDFKNKEINGVKICRNCDKPVASNRRHYCSQECMEEFNHNHDWYWIRKAILKRDRYTCSICKQRMRKRFLDVDHIIPIRMGGDPHDKENLRLLCKDCHKRKTKLDQDVLNSI